MPSHGGDHPSSSPGAASGRGAHGKSLSSGLVTGQHFRKGRGQSFRNPHVSDEGTSAGRLAVWLAARHAALRIGVVNAGVAGWTSRETLIHLKRAVLPLAPDIVVLADGRNDIFPQVFDGYRDDYSHYRPIGYDFREGNRWHRAVFRGLVLRHAGDDGPRPVSLRLLAGRLSPRPRLRALGEST